MVLSPKLELRQGQQLVMTPQLQQAIRLLQLSNIELGLFVETELERNPLLERDEVAPEPSEDAPRRQEARGRGRRGNLGEPRSIRLRSTVPEPSDLPEANGAEPNGRDGDRRTASNRDGHRSGPARTTAARARAPTWKSSLPQAVRWRTI